MSDLVKLYNPANAASLTSEEIANLQNLSSAEIKELATAYPNMTHQKAYLLIIDKNRPVEKQLPSLSTFENLWNLRERNAQRQWVAYQFNGNYKARTFIPTKAKKTEVLDLSDVDLKSLPGFKKNGTNQTLIDPADAPIKKIRKTKAEFETLPPADNKEKISKTVKKSTKTKSK